MEQSVGMYQMSVQQNISPAPNDSSKAVDWLPKFAGFSWVAYGAHFSVVITMASSPSNTGEVAMGGFFRQVLSTNWPKEEQEEKQSVSSVAWAPRGLSIGSLAAAGGKHIYLYVPKGLNCAEEGNQEPTELPMRWVKTHVLEHSCDVLSFSWSESGDGLLSVGMEIVMWQKHENSWNCLWRSQLEQPQSLSAASWSARGIAATAEGPNVTEKHNDRDHLVKIWWWEDGNELLEVDLTHPDQLLMIQWRPMRGFGSSSQSFRPVLLTCCRDGVVRLWAEIGNLGFSEDGNSKLADVETATATDKRGDGYEKQFKLAFFVSAVIDANSTLRGVLGQNIHITWPEGRGGGVSSSSNERDESSSIVVNKDSEVAMNEWLIGIGPAGSITLWSAQSLDDLSPARGPLIQLWHQGSSVLPLPSVPPSQGSTAGVEAQSSPQAVRVVVHRPHGTFWGPPSSVDVFEVWSPRLLRWSCIWPPVAAIGGPSSKTLPSSSSGAAKSIAGDGKMSTWGVSSEIVVLDGHNSNVIQIAVHPVAAVRLAASLDDQGTILLWDAKGSSSNPRSEVTGCLNPLWRCSGQLTGNVGRSSRRFNSMAWAPVVLPNDDTVLLLCHSHGVDCILISKKLLVSKSKSKSFSISDTLLTTFDWPVSDDQYGLQGIYTVTSHLAITDSAHIKNCIAVAVGSNGLKLASWKLEIQLHESRDWQGSSQNLQEPDVQEEPHVNDGPSKSFATVARDKIDSEDVLPHNDIAKPLDSAIQYVLLHVSLLGVLDLGSGGQVSSIATAISDHLLSGHSGSLSDLNEVCDIVTGGADGVLRLWKVWDGNSVNSMLSLENAGGWHCVGSLKCYISAVSKVAVCSGTSKIASTGAETPEVIDIWGADTFIEGRGFCLEGRVRLSSPAVSLRWLDGGNGASVLGVISQRDVQLFAESREQVLGSDRGLSESGLWTCLASLPGTGFSASTLSWEAQGSLIVTFGGHIMLYSNCVLPQASYTSASASSDARQALNSGKGQTSNARGIAVYEALLAHGNGTYVQSGVRLDEDEKWDQAEGLCSIVEAAGRIGCPLLDYHPTSLLVWISGGNRQNARACIRHLASYLLALSSSPNIRSHKDISKAECEQPKPKVPRTPLSELFQEREQPSPLKGQSEIGNLMTSTTASFVDFTSAFNSNYGDEDQKPSVVQPNSVVKKGGVEPLTKAEIEIISNVVRDSVTIPGLSADRKLQLLAIIDVLSEMDGVSQPSQIDGIDLPGQRFWLAFRYSVLYAKWRNDGSDARMLLMESKAMAWALQSEFKENLLSLCLPDQTISWSAMRSLGMGYWFTDGAELRKMMEKLARAQYLQKKDPKDCALLYLALDRRSVLAGLFKLSRDQKDKALTEFLFRNFKDEKNQVAALKNAYVLMGKHRHELAAAFFILGGDINSAALICAKNLCDPQLALVICSLMEGPNGSMGRDIILKYALPTAKKTRDSWLASMLQWLLGKGIESIQELTLNDGDESSSYPQTSSTEHLDGSKTPPAFPLDPDVGRYCELLASKTRVRNSANATEASNMASIATTRSAAAMKRTGLALQALEYLRGGGCITFADSGSKVDTHDMLNDGGSGAASASTSPPSDLPLTDISGREVGSGWVSKDVVTGIGRATRFSLVLQCASQLLQDHPHWGGQTCSSWQDPVISGILSKPTDNTSEIQSSTGQSEEDPVLKTSAKGPDLSSYLEGADKLCDHGLKMLEKYSVKLDGVVAALSTFSRMHHRPYLLHRLVQGLWSFKNAPDTRFHLASQSEISAPVTQYLEAFGTEAPLVLAWTVLSCGGAAGAQLGNSETPQLKHSRGEKSVPIKGGALPRFSFEELVRFGGEIQLLSKAANQHDKSPLAAGNKERGARALTLLSFIFYVAAAWLGRQTKALSKLIAPTVMDPATPPEVPQGEIDAVLWFRRLELEESTRHGPRPGKKPTEPIGFNMAGTVTIPSDDAWRVMGISLWNHLLIYVRNQLTGIASEASYSGFGRVSSSQSENGTKSALQGAIPHPPYTARTSNLKGGTTFLGLNLQPSTLSSTWLDFKSKVRDSYQSLPPVPVAGDGGGLRELVPNLSSTSDPDDFEVALLGALTSIVAGLRKQLAAHLKHSLNNSEADPLTLWLWGKPSPPTTSSASKKPTASSGSSFNFFNASSSNGQAGSRTTSSVTMYSQAQPNLFPTGVLGTEDRELKDLWELLVVREKVRSALGLEGVSGQRRKVENENISGWYSGSKAGGQGRAADKRESSGSQNRGVYITCRVPPKRIMWNAVKGVSSLQPDQGVTLSSRREEQDCQSRSQASEDRLHLSEEFSEWVDLRGHFRYPVPF